LIGNGDATLPFVMQAFDPSLENRFRNTSTMVDGHFIEPGKPFDVMLGEGLARTLGLRPGGTPVLLGNTQRGGINAMDVSVTGIFRTVSKDFDDAGIRAPIQLAQKMLRVDGAQMMIVFLDDTRRTNAVKQSLLGVLGGEKGGYEVQAWYQLPEAKQISDLENVYRSIYGVMKVVLFLFVILSIINTMNMAVLERIGEIGTLMALGTQRRGILKLFLVEGIILGLWGGVAGCLFGSAAAWVISAIGIHMPTPPGTTINWIAHIAVTPRILGSAFCMAIATSLISSVLPALKASRLDVAEALRHNI
jgi:putative ABC transport system permease protein